MRRYVGYLRVSDIRGREDTLISDEIQRKDIAAYAQLLGGTVVEWRQDLGVSGTTINRPGFLEAIELVESKAVDGLIVARLNRFARNVGEALSVVKRIEKVGGEFASAHERLDKSKYGEFTRTLFFALGELEAAVIRDNWTAAQEDALDNGRMTSPWTPAGLARDVVGERVGGGRRYGPLYPHEDLGPYITEAWERRAAGQDCGRIASFLTERRVTKSRGGYHWTTPDVHALFKRRVYLGELTHGNITRPHPHLALVDRATFEAVQRMRTPRPPRAQRQSFLLSGIVRCAGCGYAMKGYTASAAMVRRRTAEGYIYYRCQGNHSAGRCGAIANAPGAELERFVLESLYESLDIQMEGTDIVEGLAEAEGALQSAEAELAAYVALESALGSHYLEGFNARRKVAEEHSTEVARLRSEAGRGELPPVATLRQELPKWPVERQRAMIASVFPVVMVRRMPRLTPVEQRALPLSADQVDVSGLPGKGTPAIRTFTWPGD